MRHPKKRDQTKNETIALSPIFFVAGNTKRAVYALPNKNSNRAAMGAGNKFRWIRLRRIAHRCLC